MRHPPGPIVAVLLTAFALVTAATGHAQVAADFFVEIGPSRPVFFTRDFIKITVLSDSGMMVGPDLTVEILAEGTVVFSYPLIVSMAGRVVRDGKSYFTATLSLGVDERLPPGVYRARARTGMAMSALSRPFTIEPWGIAKAGVQVGLGAPTFVASGDNLVVTISLRSTLATAVLVPSGEAIAECATPWLTFVTFDAVADSAGRGLRDDRKDCARQPMRLLQPGETTSYDVDLGRLNEEGYEPRRPFRPRPGRIRLHVSIQGGYYSADRDRPGVWKEKALSNAVTTEIR